MANPSRPARVFVSFDVEHDADLGELLLKQSRRGGSGFEISAHSEAREITDRWRQDVRRNVRDADELIVICGVHSARSDRMNLELAIAKEEEMPFFLLWGRREEMCSMPAGVDRDACMYSWTWENVVQQVAQTLRDARPLEVPQDCKRQS